MPFGLLIPPKIVTLLTTSVFSAWTMTTAPLPDPPWESVTKPPMPVWSVMKTLTVQTQKAVSLLNVPVTQPNALTISSVILELTPPARSLLNARPLETVETV